MIEEYSQRQLTNAGDALNAFLGVRNIIIQFRPGMFSLCGLLFGDLPDGECDERLGELLSKSPSWSLDVSEGLSDKKRRVVFPTWTWAGWQTSVNFYRVYDFYDFSDVIPIASRIFLEDPRLQRVTSEVFKLPALWDSSNQQSIQHALDSVTTIQFDAPVIPAALILATPVKAEQNQNESSEHDAKLLLLLHLELGNNFCFLLTDPNATSFETAGQVLDIHANPGPSILENLVHNIQSGFWSCLKLWQAKVNLIHVTWVLIVAWSEDQVTAKRVSLLGFKSVGLEPEPRSDPLVYGLERPHVRLV